MSRGTADFENQVAGASYETVAEGHMRETVQLLFQALVVLI
jgi:hypothetical protein